MLFIFYKSLKVLSKIFDLTNSLRSLKLLKGPCLGADTGLNLTGAITENGHRASYVLGTSGRGSGGPAHDQGVIKALRCILSHSWHLKL